MTLGSDHSGATFYTWPIADGKDLSRGSNYQDASSIFAYNCDQDFFGSYDEDGNRGVVAYANHHQVPGKKAWTWGHGSYGTMHQADLTDADGPYNEVQTGPLLTQADVGRLDPSEVVSWQEWWYPIHDLGGFTFANRDLAANASIEGESLKLRLMGTATWDSAQVEIAQEGRLPARAPVKLSPRQPVSVSLPIGDASAPIQIEVRSGKERLAVFQVPLALPVRHAPPKRLPPATPNELTQAGWQEFLFAHTAEAERKFKEALGKDPTSVSANAGLAYLKLDSDPSRAANDARSALKTDPDCGLARFALAVASFRAGDATTSLESAWLAGLDSATAVPGRALAAQILIRQANWEAAERALAEAGPWQSDPVCRNRRALALWHLGSTKAAAELIDANVRDEPLDAVARAIAWLINPGKAAPELSDLIGGQPEATVDLVIEFSNLGQTVTALAVLEEVYLKPVHPKNYQPLPLYWAAFLAKRADRLEAAQRYLGLANQLSAELVFPHHFETLAVLEDALATNPNDGEAALLLGHLNFALGRFAVGRGLWEKAATLGAEKAVAYRALGMASQHLDKDENAAAAWLQKANHADPSDPIVARDLARVLFGLADRESGVAQTQHIQEAAEVLKGAFTAGQGRSDFVALLARAHNRLGEYGRTASLLNSVRITIWEGAREAHDLFEEAHLALGRAHLAEGTPAGALAEFNRALEYPANLATGKLENTREGHIQELRGEALAALGRQSEAIAAWRLAANEPASTDLKQEDARRKAKEQLEKAGVK